MSFDLNSHLEIATDITTSTTTADENGLTVPAHLAKIGLGRVTIMSKLKESKRLFKPRPQVGDDEELFVKRPNFGKGQPAKKPRVQQRPIANQVEEEEKEVKVEQEDAQEDRELERSPAMSTEIEASNDANETPSCSLVAPNMHGTRQLYNFLKQITTHRWVWYEFFESYLDGPILRAQYDTERYMRECCPKLMTRQLPRRAWQQLRRHMGKARRFSAAFVAQERIELERTRRILRFLQHRKFELVDLGLLVQMPQHVPLPLAVGAKVTTFLQDQQVGLCDGHILSYDALEHTYMVKINIAGRELIVNMADIRLHAVNGCKSLKLVSIIQNMLSGQSDEQLLADTLKAEGLETGRNYSKALLNALVQVQKLVAIKQKTIEEMFQINEEFESIAAPTSSRRDARQTPQREKHMRRYAADLITLHRVNSDVLQPMSVAYEYLNEYEKQLEQRQSPAGSWLRKNCRMLAQQDLKLANCDVRVKSSRTKELLLNVHTLLYICGELNGKNIVQVSPVVDAFLDSVQKRLSPSLATYFGEAIRPMLQPLRVNISRTATKYLEELEAHLRQNM